MDEATANEIIMAARAHWFEGEDGGGRARPSAEPAGGGPRLNAATPHERAAGGEPEDEPETGPLRRCILTRERLPKEPMIRFVLGPDRADRARSRRKAAGTGNLVERAGRCVRNRARQETLARAFARAARGPVTVPADLGCRAARRRLVRRIGDFWGLRGAPGRRSPASRRRGNGCRSGRAGLVLQASDGSAEERARFLSGWRRTARIGRIVPVLAPLDAAALGAVFGRDHVVHVAVAPGPARRATGDRVGDDWPAVAGGLAAGRTERKAAGQCRTETSGRVND